MVSFHSRGDSGRLDSASCFWRVADADVSTRPLRQADAPRRRASPPQALPSTRGTRGREARKRGPVGPVVRVGRAGYVFSTMVEKT